MNFVSICTSKTIGASDKEKDSNTNDEKIIRLTEKSIKSKNERQLTRLKTVRLRTQMMKSVSV